MVKADVSGAKRCRSTMLLRVLDQSESRRRAQHGTPRCRRVGRSPGRKTFQKEIVEIGSITESSPSARISTSLSGKQVAMLFVVIMVVLTAFSELSRLRGSPSAPVLKERIQ